MKLVRPATLAVALAVAAAGCGDDDASSSASSPSGTGASSASSGAGGGGPEDSPGFPVWAEKVQPAIAAACGACHVGPRFAFASLERAGAAFTDAETKANYLRFFDLLSLDSPSHSRLLEKMIDAPAGMKHAGGAVAKPGDAVFDAVVEWASVEKAYSCEECGEAAPSAWLAYVEQPELFWALASDPFRSDHGLRDRARILLQPVDPATLLPKGEPVDFLGDSFCGKDGRCDFGNLASIHAGDRIAFECRLSLEDADWVDDVRWNVCIAEVGPDGHAKNPHFLLPTSERHHGSTVARSDPFGMKQNGDPLKGPYDLHFQTRRRGDFTPVFSPDDTRVYISSQGADPRTGDSGTQAYHGTEHLGHIVAVDVDGTDARTIYVNEGGVADSPFFLRNGNVAFHTWNLERMDRHLYQQSHADGMGELPVLLGRVQGPNMWGKAVQLADGGLLGATGRRRSSIANYVLFFGDHTLGTGIDASVSPVTILDPTVFEEVLDFPDGYCSAPPEGPSCVIDQFYSDPAFAPDGRAFIAHNPEKTYVSQAEDMFLGYATGATETEQVESMRPFVPHRLGISLVDHTGAVTRVLEPPAGKALRFPAWVGKLQPPRIQPWATDEAKSTAELRIADVPIWLSFARKNDATDKANDMTVLDQIVALRVLTKDLAGNFCTSDGRPYRFAANDGVHDHPTHLGKNNATGYVRLAVETGGDAWGDVPLESDRSVRLTLPAGKLLLFQGVDAKGHVVAQRSRLLALPPGTEVDASVRREQYGAQCMSCHGTLDKTTPFVGLGAIDDVPNPGLDYATTAASKAPADVAGATPRPATFLSTIRPLLDAHCVSCHSGSAPAGELSLEKDYSPTGNYPAGKWASVPGLADPAYMAFVPAAARVPAYNYSVSYAWNFREDEAPYTQSAAYAPLIASQAPLGALAPWEPAYQNLFAQDGSRWVYLGGYFDPNFGRSDRLGGLSSDSWLIEILTGDDIDPLRTFTGPSHTSFLTEAEVREVMSVIDVGFPYAARCDDRTATTGPNAGMPWGDPSPP